MSSELKIVKPLFWSTIAFAARLRRTILESDHGNNTPDGGVRVRMGIRK